jgi:hypothetical protein
MKMYGGVDVLVHVFLTSALAGGERSASRLGRSNPGRLSGHQKGLGRCGIKNILLLPVIESLPVAYRYRSEVTGRLCILSTLDLIMAALVTISVELCVLNFKFWVG